MERPTDTLFSPGTENVLHAMRNGGRFPYGWSIKHGCIATETGADGRLQVESIPHWFHRVVDDQLHGDPGACTVEANLALFFVTSSSSHHLQYANLQALVTLEGTLDDLYLGEPCRFQYLRLDFDLTNLGPFFKEALPHMHVHGKGEPRLTVGGLGSDNPVVDFLDLIYRNYFHDSLWMNWARRTWDRYRYEHAIDDDKDHFDVIAQAFRAGHHGPLSKHYAEDLRNMKKAWRRAHDALLPDLRSSPGISALLSYGL